MNNNEIIKKIKDEKLKPISRNVFVLKEYTLWFMLFLITILGAYAFAVFFLKTSYIDFDNWYFFSNSYNSFLLHNIPIMWILFFVINIFLMHFVFKYTNKGYKYSLVFIAAISLIISFALGAVLVKVLLHQASIRDNFERQRFIKWTNPYEGRLFGQVLHNNGQYILLRDIQDYVWNVDIRYISDNSKKMIKDNETISIIGKHNQSNNFTACQLVFLNVDKERFKPNVHYKFKSILKQDNVMVKNICDFVINKK